MYEEALVSGGYVVETSQNGQQAVEKLTTDNSDYSLILLDIMMPGLDGINILKLNQSQYFPCPQHPRIYTYKSLHRTIRKRSFISGSRTVFVKNRPYSKRNPGNNQQILLYSRLTSFILKFSPFLLYDL